MTRSQIDNYEWEHRYGGNGWAVIDFMPSDCCRVTQVTQKGFGTRAFLAWRKLLTIETHLADPEDPKSPMVKRALPDDIRIALQSLRQDILEGKKIVKGTHVKLA